MYIPLYVYIFSHHFWDNDYIHTYTHIVLLYMWNHAIQSIPSEYRVIDIEVEIWLFFESTCIYLLVLTSTNLEYKDVFEIMSLSIHKISQYDTVNWEGYLMNLWIRKCDLTDWKFLVEREDLVIYYIFAYFLIRSYLHFIQCYIQ